MLHYPRTIDRINTALGWRKEKKMPKAKKVAKKAVKKVAKKAVKKAAKKTVKKAKKK